MEVIRLDARTDFRLEKLAGEPVYLVPADAWAQAALTRAFAALTGAETGRGLDLVVLGRSLHVPQARGRVARFGFEELCERPLGAADFLAIAEHFHTLVLDGIPLIAAEAAQRGQALHHADRHAL